MVDARDVRYEYDAAGQLRRIVDNGVNQITEYTYDALGRHSRETLFQGGTVIRDTRIGDVTPTLPDPPPPQSSSGGGGCGGFGVVLIMIVAIVATVLTAGAAGEAIVLANAAAEGIAAEVALSVFSAGDLAAVGFANPLTAGLAGAAGNLAGQVAGNLAGVQDGINFGQIASAGLSAGLGSAFSNAVGAETLNQRYKARIQFYRTSNPHIEQT